MATPAKTYPLSLVGEQHYQAAIAGCREGDPAQVWHEPDNPHDERALAVSDAGGRTLGYLPRDSFAHTALLDEGRGCRAKILRLFTAERGHTRVSLELQVCDGAVRERPYTRR